MAEIDSPQRANAGLATQELSTPAEIAAQLPEAILALRPVALEIEARPSRASQLGIVDYRPTHQDYQALLAKTGTITLFVAQRGTGMIDRIRHAATSSRGEDRTLAAELAEKFRQRSMVPIEQAVNTL